MQESSGMRSDTLTALEHDATQDIFLTGDTEDRLFIADSYEFDWSLADSFLTMTKWSSVLRGYLDPTSLSWFLSQEDDVWLNTLDGHTRGTGKSGKHLWGACILGFTYQHGHVHIHSRVSFIGYLAPLDLAIASLMAQHFSERDKRPVGIVWHLGSGQVHGTKSLPWFFRNHHEDMLTMPDPSPPLRLCQSSYRRDFLKADADGLPYEAVAFKPTKRFRRRWHAQYFPPGYGQQFGEPSRPLVEHHLSTLSLGVMPPPEPTPLAGRLR